MFRNIQKPPVAALLLALLMVSQAIACVEADSVPAIAPRVSKIGRGPNVQYELQARLIDAVPGDVIQLEEGR